MESKTQLRDSPTSVKDKEMSQRFIQTQIREIPELEGSGGEEGKTDQGGVASYQEKRGGGQEDTNNATRNSC
jgi:hypothetical protein